MTVSYYRNASNIDRKISDVDRLNNYKPFYVYRTLTLIGVGCLNAFERSGIFLGILYTSRHNNVKL